jgi:hypothetical protein
MALGPILLWTSQQEDQRLANGATYEPQTFVERHNWVGNSAEDTKLKVVVMAQRGYRPSLENIAASVAMPEEPALTVIGD